MDVTISVFLRKALPKWWIVVLCVIIGFGAAVYYTETLEPSYYTETTIIGANIDKILMGGVAIDDLSVSRRLAVEFVPVATSRKVASESHIGLLAYGLDIPVSSIQGMISARIPQNSNLIVIRATSSEKSLVTLVANEVSDRFIETLNSITGVTYFSVLDQAESISTSYGVNKTLVLFAGILAGGVAGIAAVFLMVILTHKIKMVEDVLGVKSVENLSLIPNHGIKY